MNTNNSTGSDGFESDDFETDDIENDEAFKLLLRSSEIVGRYKRGELTTEGTIQALIENGHGNYFEASNFLMHAAHQKELDEIRAREGKIID